jgi:hypothetical protein
MDERKDEVILALGELIQELTSKLINLRVETGLRFKAKDAEIARLKVDKKDRKKPQLKAVTNE